MTNTPIEWAQVKQYIKKGFGKGVEVPTHAVLLYGGLQKKVKQAKKGAAPSAPGAGKKMARSVSSRSTATRTSSSKSTVASKPAAAKKVGSASRQTKRTVVKKVSAKRAAKSAPAAKRTSVKKELGKAPAKKITSTKKAASKSRVAAHSKPSAKRVESVQKTGSLGGSGLRNIISKAFRH